MFGDGIPGGQIVVASHNPGKAKEIAALLQPYGLNVISAADLGLPEPEETGETFAANAELKARAAAEGSGLPAIADDSGLVVPALDGAPGIYSARWAGPERDFMRAMRRVHAELGDKDRHAAFVCVLALALPQGPVKCFEGRVEGHLVWPVRGNRGFGYDPMFEPDGLEETFGELEPHYKHRISHRADAFRKFVRGALEPDK